MTQQQAQAISELAKTQPDHARALSGDNPPKPIRRPKTPFPTGIIVMFGGLIPVACIVGFIFSLTVYVSHMTNPNLDIKTEGVWSLAQGLILLPVAYFSFKYAKKRWPYKEDYLDTHIPQPYEMKLFHYEKSVTALKSSILTSLEYELPAGFQTREFSTLLNTTFDRIASQIAAEKAKHCSNPGSADNTDGFVNLLEPGEYEAALVPAFGRAAFEARMPVFRFYVGLKLIESERRQRGFLGISK